ncbi:MAG: hypothetical protein JWM95_29 [Gemmatimonadetes bacterium]|nr:hypothetical protein [Gemmatimonadota bacterium]
MRGDWKELAKRAGYRVDSSDSITVTLDGGSVQVVRFRLEETEQVLRASSIIARRSVLAAATNDSSYRYAWERNRLSDLVGFTVDGRGRLIGETWIPLDELTSEEFGLYLSELARVCDWHEFRLSGEDTF